MKVFYHNDNDGRAAGAVVGRFNRHFTPQFIPMLYGNPFPLDEITNEEAVYIVDYSITPKEMSKLLARDGYTVWIDHHMTALKAYEDFPYRIDGLRENGVAGCQLAWRFFTPAPEPMTLKLIGDRDVWKWEFGEMTAHLHAGLGMYDSYPDSVIWDRLIGEGWDVPGGEGMILFNKILDEGRAIIRFKDQWYKDIREAIGFKTIFEGYPALAVNAPRTGSEVFGAGHGKMPDFPLLLVYWHDGEKFGVSVFSDVIDVDKIVTKWGGGGHKRAGGFECYTLPFKRDPIADRLWGKEELIRTDKP